jgi:hypothetical protein
MTDDTIRPLRGLIPAPIREVFLNHVNVHPYKPAEAIFKGLDDNMEHGRDRRYLEKMVAYMQGNEADQYQNALNQLNKAALVHNPS